jgi:hypothetical protein
VLHGLPMRLAPLLGVLQNDTAPIFVDRRPFSDLVQGAKAAEARKVIVQAAISHAGRLRGAVDINHLLVAMVRGFEFDHTGDAETERYITRIRVAVQCTISAPEWSVAPNSTRLRPRLFAR